MSFLEMPLDVVSNQFIIERIGFTTAFCTTTAFIPQLVRVLRLKSARDISLPTFLLFSLGVFLWLVYGMYSGSRPVIASNSFTLLLRSVSCFSTFKYDRTSPTELKS